MQAWIGTLGDGKIYRFAVNFKTQLVACRDDSLTISETIQNKVAATKAGYGSWRAARMASTFLVTYPDPIFKKDGSKDTASRVFFFRLPLDPILCLRAQRSLARATPRRSNFRIVWPPNRVLSTGSSHRTNLLMKYNLRPSSTICSN